MNDTNEPVYKKKKKINEQRVTLVIFFIVLHNMTRNMNIDTVKLTFIVSLLSNLKIIIMLYMLTVSLQVYVCV